MRFCGSSRFECLKHFRRARLLSGFARSPVIQRGRFATVRRSPLLLLDILREGRVLVDRDDEWRGLRRGESEVQRKAAAAEAVLDHRIAELAELVGAGAR